MWKLWKTREKQGEEELELRVRKLEASFKELELEWENVWQKVRRALGRYDKLAALERAQETEKSAGDDLLSRESILQAARRGH